MSQTRIYGLDNCDSCRKARRWLEARGIDFQFVDYRAKPVPATTLKAWASAVGGWGALINRRSASWRQLDASEREADSDADWMRLVATHPTLVKRPVLVDADSVRVGFDEAAWAAHFGG